MTTAKTFQTRRACRIGRAQDYPLRWSLLKTIAESPSHFIAALEDDREESDALLIGSAIHCLVFEPFAFADRFAVWETSAGQRRGKAWDDFRVSASASGQRVLREADLEDARRVADAVRDHRAVQTLLTQDAAPIVERRIHWTETDAEGTVWHFAGTPDCLIGGLLIDLKTTVSAKPSRFGTQAASLCYHGQLAHYGAGIEALTGASVRGSYLIAAEKKAPFDVGVFEVLPDDLRLGLSARAEMLSTLARCQASDEWPGRVPDIAPLRLPAWAYASDAATPEDYDDASSDLEN
jgi:exodeoxyribonuclease VIII